MADRTYRASTLERELQDSITLLERLRTAKPLVALITPVQRSVGWGIEGVGRRIADYETTSHNHHTSRARTLERELKNLCSATMLVDSTWHFHLEDGLLPSKFGFDIGST
jgi:hypothetical protein